MKEQSPKTDSTSAQASNGNDGHNINGSSYYEQGTEAATIQFMIVCKNIPIGAVVEFHCDEAGPVPLIAIPPTVVMVGPSFVTGVSCSVPANFTGTIYYSVVSQAQIPANASVQIQAAYMVQS